jgi:hypothetical protein
MPDIVDIEAIIKSNPGVDHEKLVQLAELLECSNRDFSSRALCLNGYACYIIPHLYIRCQDLQKKFNTPQEKSLAS